MRRKERNSKVKVTAPVPEVGAVIPYHQGDFGAYLVLCDKCYGIIKPIGRAEVEASSSRTLTLGVVKPTRSPLPGAMIAIVHNPAGTHMNVPGVTGKMTYSPHNGQSVSGNFYVAKVSSSIPVQKTPMIDISTSIGDIRVDVAHGSLQVFDQLDVDAYYAAMLDALISGGSGADEVRAIWETWKSYNGGAPLGYVLEVFPWKRQQSVDEALKNSASRSFLKLYKEALEKTMRELGGDIAQMTDAIEEVLRKAFADFSTTKPIKIPLQTLRNLKHVLIVDDGAYYQDQLVSEDDPAGEFIYLPPMSIKGPVHAFLPSSAVLSTPDGIRLGVQVLLIGKSNTSFSTGSIVIEFDDPDLEPLILEVSATKKRPDDDYDGEAFRVKFSTSRGGIDMEGVFHRVERKNIPAVLDPIVEAGILSPDQFLGLSITFMRDQWREKLNAL